MRTHAYIDFMGEMFSPAEAERLTGLLLVDKHEPGHIARYGKNRGKPVPYGTAVLSAPEDVSRSEKLDWVLDAALPHAATFRQLGADRSQIWIVEHFDSQINMAYSPAELEKLSRLGLTLCVSGYEVEQKMNWQEANKSAA